MSTVKANEYRNLLNTGSNPNITLAQNGSVEVGEDLNVPQGSASIGGNTSITGTLTVTGATTANSDITGNIRGDVKNPSGDVVLDVGTQTGTNPGSDATFTGNAASASKWDNATTIQLTGDVTGTVSIDGAETSNAELSTTIGSLTVDLGDIKNIGATTILGNKTASAAPPTALSKADATALINIYTAPTSNTDGIKGLVPNSAQADHAANAFLKIDGNWTVINEFTGLTGDVTSGSNGATTIAADAVTYSKMQNITGERLLGKTSASAGAIGEIDKAGLRTFIGDVGSTTDGFAGLVPAISGASAWNAVGTSNIYRYVLYAESPYSSPEWADKSDVVFAKPSGPISPVSGGNRQQKITIEATADRGESGLYINPTSINGTTGNYYNYGTVEIGTSNSSINACLRIRGEQKAGMEFVPTASGFLFNSINDTGSGSYNENLYSNSYYDKVGTALSIEKLYSTSPGTFQTACHIYPYGRSDLKIGKAAGYLQSTFQNYFLEGYIKTVKYQTLDPQSDRNLKENITESSLGLDFIKTLNPVQFNWKDDEGDKKLSYGFIAQDIEEKVNNGLSFRGWKDGNYPNPNENWEEDGEPEIIDGFQTLDITQFIAPLTKAVQELSAQVEALTTRVTALEG